MCTLPASSTINSILNSHQPNCLPEKQPEQLTVICLSVRPRRPPPLRCAPQVCGAPLDLFTLFVGVAERGGAEAVEEAGAWAQLARPGAGPRTDSSAKATAAGGVDGWARGALGWAQHVCVVGVVVCGWCVKA